MPYPKDWSHIKVGDTVTRNFYGNFGLGRQVWKVTAVDDNFITCGLGWQFERTTGFEYDEDCGSGTKFGRVISHLV